MGKESVLSGVTKRSQAHSVRREGERSVLLF